MQIFKKRFFILLIFLLITICASLFFDVYQKQKESTAIVIGSKNCTENQILSEMIASLLEKNTNLTIKRKFNLEGTLICFEALKSKDIDLYPEYSGTALFSILKQNLSDDKNSFAYLKKIFLEKFNIEWLDPFGFENKYVLLMQKQKCDKLKIYNLSNLKDYMESHNLKIALDPEFSIRTELSALNNVYKLHLKHEIIDQSLLYFSLNSDVVDVTNGFSTDSKINKYDLQILKDNKNVLPSYIAAPIVRYEILEKYPQIRKELKKLKGKITDEKIKKLIYLADENKQKIYDIVNKFLIEEKII